MNAPGYVDLHCHYLPAVDDGVRTTDEGLALCRGLEALGYTTLIATPHMRTAMFDNEPGDLTRAHDAFAAAAREHADRPALGLAAEHFVDDVFAERFARGEVLRYPGGHAMLLELPPDRFPLALGDLCFRMRLQGARPVIAHPERYPPLFRSTAAIAPLLDRGVLAQLDLMSLVDRYGRAARKAAERMLREHAYAIAASDAHRVEHVPVVGEAIERLHAVAGPAYARNLLADTPAALLAGRLE